jgi:hypothetical protein
MPARYLGEEYNYVSHENPCTVVCRYDPLHESIKDSEEHSRFRRETEMETPYTFAEYKNLPYIEAKLAAHAVCGPDHQCDADGCCAKVVEDPKDPDPGHEEGHEHEEPKEPEDPHHEDNHEEPKDPDPEHENKDPEPPKEEVEKQYNCVQPGEFVDEEDATSFFRCYLKSAHIKCADGMVFDHEKKVCHTPVPPEVDFEQLITCKNEGYYRNPYDCKRFFRCYFSDESERTANHLRVAFYQCPLDHVFDNVATTCMQAENTAKCENREIPNEPEAPQIVVPEYEKLLKCEHEGYFRNPYQCSLFYRCYYNDNTEHDLNLALFKCENGLVFDEVSKNCVSAERSAVCHNKPLPDDSHHASH